ncbi:ComEA family DNA-binding protein [Glutamicibacter sp. JC586]|uniref:ComEA family DNA-binding protein n=1 Tax=Glutamicibacter sp. JC586 TaxID=2590552 RepID=UPI00135B8EB9|nr:ComEA family DNA-binding protein [Glutamicibacter sp. JC586]
MGRHDFFSKYAPRPGRLRFAISRVAVLALVIVVLGWIAISILLAPPPKTNELETVPLAADPTSSSSASAAAPGPSAPSEATVAPQVTVHVVGAVKKPGVYQLPEGSRITDAVQAAGGATTKAQPQLVNLAAKLVDGQQIILPGTGDSSSAQQMPVPSAEAKISINSADAQALQELPGIGPALADRIIEFRTKNGPFKTVEELDAVSGIGPAMLEKLGDLVVP